MDKDADQVLVGEIGAAQGLKGEVRLRSYTQTPADIANYGSLQDETGAREIEIERVRITPKAIVARIKGVTTREGAEALNRTKLYASRAKLRPAEKAKDGEWYVADLVGLTAVNADGAELGAMGHGGGGQGMEWGGGGRERGGPGEMSDEDRETMRKRSENMTPQEREAMKQRRRQGTEKPADGGQQ